MQNVKEASTKNYGSMYLVRAAAPPPRYLFACPIEAAEPTFFAK